MHNSGKSQLGVERGNSCSLDVTVPTDTFYNFKSVKNQKKGAENVQKKIEIKIKQETVS